MGLSAVVLRSAIPADRGCALVAPALSQSGSLFTLVVTVPYRRGRVAGVCLLVGERTGCVEPLWATANGRYHYRACASSGFAGQHGAGGGNHGALGDAAG